MTRQSDPSVRRRQLLQALGAAGAASLAGCSVSTSGNGGGGNNGGSDSGSGDSSKMASSVTGWGWNIAAKALKDAAKNYNEQKGANVDVKVMGGDTWEQKFQTAITSGTGAPEFSSIQNYDVTNYASINGLKDLTSRIDEAGIRDEIVDGKWKAVKYDGKDYAVPWDIGPTGIFYKRDKYEEAGIDAASIETWDQFIEEGKKMPEGSAMINIPSQSDNLPGMWRMLFRQLGGQPFTEDGAISIHNEKGVRAAQLMKDMQDAGIAKRVEQWSAGWFTSFKDGSIASLATAAWMDGTLRAELPETKGNWGVFKLPAFEKGGSRASNRGGSNLAIPSQISDEAKVNRAADYCIWSMTTPEVQNNMLQNWGLFPSLKTAYDADFYDEGLEFYNGQAIFRLFAEVATEIEPYRYTQDTPVVQQSIGTELGKMLSGKQGAKEAMETAAKSVADQTGRELA